jgi:hypothetical protein
LRLQGRSTWAIKFTGSARSAYMKAVFPDIRYIWISRAPIAVGWSNYKRRWWKNIAEVNGIDLGDDAQALPFYSALSRRLDAVGLAEIDRADIPVHRVDHEAFVEDPMRELPRAARFVGLDPAKFESAYLERLEISDMRARELAKERSAVQTEFLRAGLERAEPLTLAPYHEERREAVQEQVCE